MTATVVSALSAGQKRQGLRLEQGKAHMNLVGAHLGQSTLEGMRLIFTTSGNVVVLFSRFTQRGN